MACVLIPGQRDWSMTRDEKGHREYKIRFMVYGQTTDGPAAALATPGLPVIGSSWAFDGDIDLWAFCRPEVTVTPAVTDEPNRHFQLEFTYGTKPLDFCQDDFIDNPTLRPNKVSGSFNKYTEEAHYDRFGYPIRNSAHEMLRGTQVEFDKNRGSVKIQQNVNDLQLGLMTSMIDTLNDRTMWGLPPRCIKLSACPWERKFWGACNIYYDRTLEFDIRFAENDSFDRVLLDEGTKVLNGHWSRSTGAWILDNIPPNLRVPTGLTTEFQPIGGSMPVGIHGYRVTATNALGETTPTAEVVEAVDVTGGVVILRWDAVPGATGYKIYFNDFFLDNETGTLYIDDGTTVPGIGTFPGTNTTGSAPDMDNPQHFIRFQDRRGELTRVVLNGLGVPAGVTVGSGTGFASGGPGQIIVQKYSESNFFLLGIPTTL